MHIIHQKGSKGDRIGRGWSCESDGNTLCGILINMLNYEWVSLEKWTIYLWFGKKSVEKLKKVHSILSLHI